MKRRRVCQTWHTLFCWSLQNAQSTIFSFAEVRRGKKSAFLLSLRFSGARKVLFFLRCGPAEQEKHSSTFAEAQRDKKSAFLIMNRYVYTVKLYGSRIGLLLRLLASSSKKNSSFSGLQISLRSNS